MDSFHHEVLQAFRPLNFPDASFDLVNARLIAFLPKEAWPRLMQECRRVLRPGGYLCLTEMEWLTNSLACEQLQYTFSRALKAAGQSYSPDGRLIGLTPMLTGFLKDAGFLNVELHAHVIDLSVGTAAHQSQCESWKSFYKLLQPFFVSTHVATSEEVEQAYVRMLSEIVEPSFRGLIFIVSALGVLPI
jgi:SAM-dependent methyltransferase